MLNKQSAIYLEEPNPKISDKIMSLEASAEA